MTCRHCRRAVFFEQRINVLMHVTLPIGWAWHEAAT